MNISSTEREQQKVAWLQSLHDGPEEQNCVGVRGESTLQNTMVLSRSTRERLSDRTRRVGVSSQELKRPESWAIFPTDYLLLFARYSILSVFVWCI